MDFKINSNVSGQQLAQQLREANVQDKSQVLFKPLLPDDDGTFATINKDLLGPSRSKDTRKGLIQWAKTRGLQQHHIDIVKDTMPKGKGVSIATLELVADIVAHAEVEPKLG